MFRWIELMLAEPEELTEPAWTSRKMRGIHA